MVPSHPHHASFFRSPPSLRAGLLTSCLALVWLTCAPETGEGASPQAPRTSRASSPSPDLKVALAHIDAGRHGQALEPLRSAAAAGEPAAMTQLALLYHLGRGVAEDDDEAYRWFGAAAQRDDALAMFWLGRMYLLGHGPPRQSPDADREAARWLFESARRGLPEGQYYLGLLFMAGTGVTRSEQEAMKWIRRAALAGHSPAKAFLAQR